MGIVSSEKPSLILPVSGPWDQGTNPTLSNSPPSLSPALGWESIETDALSYLLGILGL